MGRAGDDGGGGRPSDGGSPDGLPGLPAEWGVIVIPDDLSALADEAAAIRAELRLSRPRTRWQRFAARPLPRRLRRAGRFLVRAPALIVALAVVVTVASLFASAWPGPPRTPATPRSPGTSVARGIDTLPALQLIGPDGGTVALRGQLPAVILLTDGCGCAQLLTDTIAAVPSDVAVVTVATGKLPPGGPPAAPDKIVWTLHDPTDQLRTELDLGPPDGTAAALLVADDGEIVSLIPSTASADAFRTDLARL